MLDQPATTTKTIVGPGMAGEDAMSDAGLWKFACRYRGTGAAHFL
jgi:hypothetical protein